DGLIDDADPSVSGDLVAYADGDGDGYGAGPGVLFCAVPEGFVTGADDCDDEAADAHPGAREGCGNAVDENCDDDAPDCALAGDVGLDTAAIAIAAEPFSSYEQFGAAMTTLPSAQALAIAAPGDPWSDAVLLFAGLGPGAYDEHDATATL